MAVIARLPRLDGVEHAKDCPDQAKPLRWRGTSTRWDGDLEISTARFSCSFRHCGTGTRSNGMAGKPHNGYSSALHRNPSHAPRVVGTPHDSSTGASSRSEEWQASDDVERISLQQ